jgi:hypothetical protein
MGCTLRMHRNSPDWNNLDIIPQEGMGKALSDLTHSLHGHYEVVRSLLTTGPPGF